MGGGSSYVVKNCMATFEFRENGRIINIFHRQGKEMICDDKYLASLVLEYSRVSSSNSGSNYKVKEQERK